MPVGEFGYKYEIEKDVIEGVRQMGLTIRDLNRVDQDGFAFAQATSKNSIQCSTYRPFLHPVLRRKNRHMMFQTFATRVIIDSETKKATGIEFIRDDGSIARFSSTKELIICAGVINSPIILFLPGIGDRQLLDYVDIPVIHHLFGIGGNLQDHVGCQIVITTNEPNHNDLNWAKAIQYVMFLDGAMSTIGNPVMGFIQTKYENQYKSYTSEFRNEFSRV